MADSTSNSASQARCFGGDDAREQTRKIKFDHRRMNTRATVKVEATSVSLKQVKG